MLGKEIFFSDSFFFKLDYKSSILLSLFIFCSDIRLINFDPIFYYKLKARLIIAELQICLQNPEAEDRNLGRYRVIRKLNEGNNNPMGQMLAVRDLMNHNQLLLAQKIDLTNRNLNEEQRDRCIAKLRILERIGDYENESIIQIRDKFSRDFGMNGQYLFLITKYYEVS